MGKKSNIQMIITFICISVFLYDANGQTDKEIEEFTKNRSERLAWWEDARYGMFIHWGAYAELAGEWQGKRVKGPGEWIMYNAQIPVKEYVEVVQKFKPVEFSAREWVKIAKEAGMKYIVITAKHCDGFAMFHSDVSTYNVVDATSFARDPIAELKQVCKEEGIKLGFYYSHNWDWHAPHAKGLANTWDYPDHAKKFPQIYYTKKCIPQIKELMLKYEPDIMWFDVPTDIPKEQSFEILRLIREIDPDCIINDRISHEHMEKKLVMGDYYTPEQYIPQDPDMNFETCMTLNDTWGYKYYDQDWKDTETIVKNLVLNASMGGNYLLNVGPDHLGNIPSTSVQILKSAGHWLDANGESIYGTKKSPLKHVFYENGACTAGEDNKLYIHLFQWPETDELVIGEIRANVTGIYFLADKDKTNITYQLLSGNDYILDLNPANISKTLLNQEVKTIVLEYTGKLKPQELPPIIDPFNTACFTPADASFSGNIDYGFNQRWGEHRGYELKEWNKGGAMTWDFRTIREGKYAVELVYGAHELSDDNDIMVSIGGKSFKHKIREYDGWYKVKKHAIGEVKLEQSESGQLVIKSGYSNTHIIANFRKVRLVPIRN